MSDADLRVGSEVQIDSAGTRLVRTFDIPMTALTGTDDEKIYQGAISATIPQVGVAHPSIAGIEVLNIRGRIESDAARYDVEYGEPSEAESLGTTVGNKAFRFSAGIQSVETQVDASGDPLEIIWTGVASDIFDDWSSFHSDDPAVTHRQAFAAEVARPIIRVSIDDIQIGLPKSDTINFLAHINSSSWNGYASHTAFLAGISAARVESSTNKYRVTYDFEVTPLDAWDLTHRIEVTRTFGADHSFKAAANVVPKGVTSGNGIETFTVIPTANFNALGLTF